ncbi:MAG: cell division protein FtsL [bacterium]|nr:cell division protein FtsL [bacterium]
MHIEQIKYFTENTPPKNFPNKEDKSQTLISALTNNIISKQTVIFLLSVTFFALSLLFITWINVGQFQSGYLIAELENKQLFLQENYQNLELEIFSLKRPERIQKFAKQKLNLSFPTFERVIHF